MADRESDDNNSSRQKCTCGPFPIVDTSSELLSNASTKISAELQDACESHGCFHLIVDNSFLLNAMMNDGAAMEKKRDATTDNTSTASQLPEPALLETFFPQGNILSTAAVYRSAGESGNKKSEIAEPKQSWEYSRCQSSHRFHEVAVDLFLNKWSHAMHQLTKVLANLLHLPKPMIAEHTCCCRSSSSPCCNYDLLRLFRYDPVLDSSSCLQTLGSSEHTDWGTFTIVWQDHVGGLQTYCPKHDLYNNVTPPESRTSKVSLFVHVGDFLCIAKGFDRNGVNFIWPSPKHRVVSPISNPRFSLVYFAYPEPQFTLAQATESLLSSSQDSKICHPNNQQQIIPLQQLSLLCDQSANATSTTGAWDILQDMYHQPFASHVIPNKWSQVQRSSNSPLPIV